MAIASLLVACSPSGTHGDERAGAYAGALASADGGDDSGLISVATPTFDASATPIPPGMSTPAPEDAGTLGDDASAPTGDDAGGAPVAGEDSGPGDGAAEEDAGVTGDICAYALAHAVDERSTTTTASMSGPTNPSDTTTLFFSPPAVLVYQDQEVNVALGGNPNAALSIFTFPGDIPPPGTLNNDIQTPGAHGTTFTTDADPTTYCVRVQITRAPAPPVNGAVVFEKH
jgi:hypothetical protein